ncbi:MAG: ester cyclase [Labilithrix sp.]|nr:ester cyclase [Labilithrix sp.]MCW5809823.1 ester cyclase [Labilithrix sp.]
MRKLSFALVAVGFAALNACGEEQPPPKAPEPPPPATTAPPVASAPPAEAEPPKKSPMELQQATMQGFGEAYMARDAKKLASLYTDGGVLKVAGAPADASGREAIAQSYQKLFEAFPDYKGNASRVWIKGDTVAVEWAFNATHKGDLWGIKATEKPVGSMGIDLLWFTPEGQIKEDHTYYDGNTILSQAGISKQKGRPIPAIPTKTETIVSNNGPEEAKNIDAVKALSAALEGKKEADFLALLADNIEYDDYTQPQGMKGKADGKKFFKEMTTGFPDAKHTVEKTLAVNDYVISEETMTGTHKGSFFGVPATKKPVTVKHLTIFQFKDGKMVRGWAYSNGADFAQQLGLAPKPGAAPAAKK